MLLSDKHTASTLHLDVMTSIYSATWCPDKLNCLHIRLDTAPFLSGYVESGGVVVSWYVDTRPHVCEEQAAHRDRNPDGRSPR